MKPTEPTTVISSKGSAKKRPQFGWIIAGVVLALLVLGFGLWLLLSKSMNAGDKLVESLPAGTDAVVGTTDTDDIAKVIAYKYNVKFSDLENKSLSGQIDSYAMAQDVSTAFVRLKNYKKALEAYIVAADKKPADAGAVFYEEYCRVAFLAGDKERANAQCDNALGELKKYPEGDQYREEVTNRIEVLKLQSAEENKS